MAKNTQPIAKRCKALGISPTVMGYSKKETNRNPGGLDAFHKAYADGIISKIIATNLTYRTPELLAAPWFAEADMSKYIAYIIATLNHDRTLSGLLNPWNRIKALLERYRNEQAQSGIRLI